MTQAVYVAGHNGMAGSAIVRQLQGSQDINIVTRSRRELDLLSQGEVHAFFKENKINQVYLAAAKVGGIHANSTYPAEFIYENLMIEANIIHQAYQSGVRKLLFLGSSCIYPKFSSQPMKEGALLTGKLEETNEPYAIAKIAGIKLCESYNRQYGTDYRSVMPTNLYGQNDNFDLENSHVIPALMRKVHEAKLKSAHEVEVWGTGKVKREFLHVDDMAAACIYVMNLDSEHYQELTTPMQAHINVGYGDDISIKELAELIVDVVGFKGKIRWNSDKPDGTPRKLLDASLLNQLGWQANIGLKQGLADTYQWFLENYAALRK